MVAAQSASGSTDAIAMNDMSWQSAASAKRASLIGLIPPSWRLDTTETPSALVLPHFFDYICRFLSPREQEITDASSDIILTRVRARDWAAVDVTRAFCHRASIAHQLV